MIRKMKMLNIDEKERLINAAIQARHWSYAPYSNYAVGAALLTESGKLYDGVNIENASYSATVCAERVAVFKAISEGERSFRGIAVVSSNGVAPCGVCRQVLIEFDSQMVVIIVTEDGRVVRETTAADLLPDAFTPSHLGKVSPPEE